MNIDSTHQEEIFTAIDNKTTPSKRKNLIIIISLVCALTLAVVCIVFLLIRDKRQESPIDVGYELIERVQSMADEDFFSMYCAEPSDYNDYLSDIRETDYSHSDIYKLTGNENFQEGLEQNIDGEVLQNLSKDQLDILYESFHSGSTLRINILGFLSHEALVVSSVLSSGKSFVNTDIKSNFIFIYIPDEGFPMIVDFKTGNNGAISASCAVIPIEEDITSIEDMEDFLEKYNAIHFDVKKVN